MRLRNVKDANNILNDSEYFISEPETKKGRWRNVFNNDNPIMLEIGMGKGDFIIGMALRHPEWNFIGIEKYESVLVRGVQKLNTKKLANVKVIRVDAKDVAKYFDAEIDSIYLNFSDPWPKKRHYKRRLTYIDFLKEYDKIFESDAKVIMKTDNDCLFESTLINLNNYGYIFEELYLDISKKEGENVQTEYEIKFSELGYKIKYIKAKKITVGKIEKK